MRIGITITNYFDEFESFNEVDELTASNLFQHFQFKYDRNYAGDGEHRARYEIFKQNLKIIDQMNRDEEGSASYGIGKFADLTKAEFMQYTGLRNDLSSFYDPMNITAEIPDIELPTEFDWRSKNVVAPVKDQNPCGSCWAFSAVGNIESLNAIRTKKMETYSEQELVDCDQRDDGCDGGIARRAVEEIHRIGGLVSDHDYPYRARQGQCKFAGKAVKVRTQRAVLLPRGEEEMAKYMVEHGPISISLNGEHMHHYRGGVAHPSKQQCKTSTNHEVLAVGIGTEGNNPFWILKNSWGENWGEEGGYYLLYRGDNTCGIGSLASSAILV